MAWINKLVRFILANISIPFLGVYPSVASYGGQSNLLINIMFGVFNSHKYSHTHLIINNKARNYPIGT